MTVSTAIYAIYTIIPDVHTVRIWVFIEDDTSMNREIMRLRITEILGSAISGFPKEIIHFEFHVITNAKYPVEVEPGGNWTYVHPAVNFVGEISLVPAAEQLVQVWKAAHHRDKSS